VIADSSLIMAHLERKYGAQFYAGLTPREWGEAHAFSRMAEEHLVFALTYNRWAVDWMAHICLEMNQRPWIAF